MKPNNEEVSSFVTELVERTVAPVRAENAALQAKLAAAERRAAAITEARDTAASSSYFKLRGVRINDYNMGRAETQASGISAMWVRRQSVDSVLYRGGLAELDGSGELDATLDEDEEVYEMSISGRRVFCVLASVDFQRFLTWWADPVAAKGGAA
jgi:hypothetical protein